jgi:hypothetical protein
VSPCSRSGRYSGARGRAPAPACKRKPEWCRQPRRPQVVPRIGEWDVGGRASEWQGRWLPTVPGAWQGHGCRCSKHWQRAESAYQGGSLRAAACPMSTVTVASQCRCNGVPGQAPHGDGAVAQGGGDQEAEGSAHRQAAPPLALGCEGGQGMQVRKVVKVGKVKRGGAVALGTVGRQTGQGAYWGVSSRRAVDTCESCDHHVSPKRRCVLSALGQPA